MNRSSVFVPTRPPKGGGPGSNTPTNVPSGGAARSSWLVDLIDERAADQARDGDARADEHDADHQQGGDEPVPQ